MEDRVSVSISHGVADVRLVRADKMNALDVAMFEALVATSDRLSREKGLRAVVLSGEGRAFCAGLDMGRFAAMKEHGGEGIPGAPKRDLAARTHGLANHSQQAVWGFRQLPVPVIAAVHGVAFGGGFQIMSGADIRIAAPDTRFAIRESYWGLVPDMAGFPIWRGLVRDDVLRELVYTSREFGAEEALHHGFITRIAEDPHAAALALAHDIAAKSPNAIRGAKRLCNMAFDADPRAMLEAETDEQVKVIGQPPMMEQVAANIQKRPARFGDAD